MMEKTVTAAEIVGEKILKMTERLTLDENRMMLTFDLVFFLMPPITYSSAGRPSLLV